MYLFKTASSGAPPSSSGAEKGKGPPAQFFLGEKGGEIMSADVDLEPLERSGSPNFFESEDFFQVSGVVGRGGVGAMHGGCRFSVGLCCCSAPRVVNLFLVVRPRLAGLPAVCGLA